MYFNSHLLVFVDLPMPLVSLRECVLEAFTMAHPREQNDGLLSTGFCSPGCEGIRGTPQQNYRLLEKC